MNFRAIQSGRSVGQMTNLRRNSGLFHTCGEVLKRFDLAVGGGHELRHVRRIGHGKVTPLADDMQHAFLGKWHQLGKRGGEPCRREAVAAKAGIDLNVHASGLAEFARGGGHGIDTRQGADGHVDVGSGRPLIRLLRRW